MNSLKKIKTGFIFFAGFLLFSAFSAQASECPDLTGNYYCNKDKAYIIQQFTNAGDFTVFSFGPKEQMEGPFKEDFIIDGQSRFFKEDGMDREFTARCENDALVVSANPLEVPMPVDIKIKKSGELLIFSPEMLMTPEAKAAIDRQLNLRFQMASNPASLDEMQTQKQIKDINRNFDRFMTDIVSASRDQLVPVPMAAINFYNNEPGDVVITCIKVD